MAKKTVQSVDPFEALKEAKSMLQTLRDECEHYDDECGDDEWYLADDFKKTMKLINATLKAKPKA